MHSRGGGPQLHGHRGGPRGGATLPSHWQPRRRQDDSEKQPFPPQRTTPRSGRAFTLTSSPRTPRGRTRRPATTTSTPYDEFRGHCCGSAPRYTADHATCHCPPLPMIIAQTCNPSRCAKMSASPPRVNFLALKIVSFSWPTSMASNLLRPRQAARSVC